MYNQPLSLHSFPQAILHIDGDAFFASCEQSKNPELKGKAVITGKERGIVSSMSYEAKAAGVTRAMRLSEVLKICPDAVILPSDYETYSLLSKRFYNIVRRFTPDVEEYSIDECFADITGLQRPLRMSYEKIAEKIKQSIDAELGFTFSVGLAPNKVVAKIASKWKKPSGLTIIPANEIHKFTENLPVEKVWGIGVQTTALLAKLGVTTTLQFAKKPEDWVKKYLTKPHYEIWQELNGNYINKVDTEPKNSYQSIQKVKTFSPPSKDKIFVFAQLCKNIENATIKARKYKLSAKGGIIFLRTQSFQDYAMEIKFASPTSIPNDVISAIKPAFEKIFNSQESYRSTGIMLFGLEEQNYSQLDLFGAIAKKQTLTHLYEAVDVVREKYGKHTLFLGASFHAHKFAQHMGDRGQAPERRKILLKGETQRKHLAIPTFLGFVS
jgi:DNA polymerase-4/DNA polymerase V